MDLRLRRNRSAFTLLEVLVALALFALSAIVLSTAYLNVMIGYEMVRHNYAREEDIRFIRSLVLQEPVRENVEQGGELESVYLGNVMWQALVQQMPVPDLFHVTLEISYSGIGDAAPRDLVQEFTLLRPSWSDPVEREQLQAETAQWLLETQRIREGR